jgi:hypothetical protein
MSKLEAARRYKAAHPAANNCEIAEKVGCSDMTVGRAIAQGQHNVDPEFYIGRDGKKYRRPRRPQQDAVRDQIAAAKTRPDPDAVAAGKLWRTSKAALAEGLKATRTAELYEENHRLKQEIARLNAHIAELQAALDATTTPDPAPYVETPEVKKATEDFWCDFFGVTLGKALAQRDNGQRE